MGSNPSLYSVHGSEENLRNDRAREDLYQWMAKQEPIKVVSLKDFLLQEYIL